MKTATTPGKARAGAVSMAVMPGVGLRAAQDGSMQHVGEFDVIDKGGPAGEKADIFLPGDRRANIGLDHIMLPYWPVACKMACTMGV